MLGTDVVRDAWFPKGSIRWLDPVYCKHPLLLDVRVTRESVKNNHEKNENICINRPTIEMYKSLIERLFRTKIRMGVGLFDNVGLTLIYIGI